MRAIFSFERPVVLATASEARRKLIADLGLRFIPDSVEIDESILAGEDLAGYVERLAKLKANAVIPPSLEAVIITVDTAIGIGGQIIGKPGDESSAREMLESLLGREHEVASCIAVRDIANASVQTETTITQVKFWQLTPEAIDWYLASGEWKGRAGAYAIQGKGASLVEDVRGCFTNVIGISIPALIRMLQRLKH